jgi:hypothetical protein
MRRRAAATTAVLAVVLGLLTACGEEDAPDPEPTDTVEFDPEALDLGRIDPTATDLGTALDGARSRTIGAYQLASHLVLPQELRSDLHKYGVESGTLTDPGEFEYMLSDAAPAMAGAETGYLTRRVDENADAWVTTALVQFPDAAAAQNAAEVAGGALTAPDAEYGVDLVAEPFAADPQTIALVTNTPDVANQIYVLRAFGPFLAYAWVYDINGDMDDVRTTAEEFVSEQEIALEEVDPVQISESPRVRDLDPSGLWGMTLAVDGRGSLADTAYVAGGHAAETRQINTDGISRAFSRSGVTRVASNLTTIYATEDDEAADSLIDAFHTQATELGMVDGESPVGLDDAVCVVKEDEEDPNLTFWPTYLCFYAFGAYVLESSGVSAEEAHQRLSAQAVLIHERQQDQKRSSG